MLLLRPRTNPELLDAALELGRRLLPRLFPLAFAANLAAAVATKLLLMKSSPLGVVGRVLEGSWHCLLHPDVVPGGGRD